MKPEDVKIIQITAVKGLNGNDRFSSASTAIYGLGDDGEPYYWQTDTDTWMLA